jgi:ubiquinone/menaquinone biosynthesis C-methylase UbiE
MIERYASKEEYSTLFTNLTREDIAKEIKIGKKVLDIAAGSSYFTIELAKRNPDSEFTAIDIYEGSIQQSKKNIKKARLHDRIRIIKMDATSLELPDESFDTVVNYLGLEDIHMTRERKGVVSAFNEVYRVLRPGGCFFFVAMPPDLMETVSQKTEVEVFGWICGAKWLSSKEYLGIIEETGFIFNRTRDYFTGLKLTVEQAREEIRYACENVERNYGVVAKGFDETWSRFGSQIEAYGMGHYSKTILFDITKPQINR